LIGCAGWIEEVRPHPTNPEREIYKWHEEAEGRNVFIYYYDRAKGSKSTNSKEKHCYCKRCKKCFSGHCIDKRQTHPCLAAVFNTVEKSAFVLAKQFEAAYEQQPTTMQVLTLLIAHSNSAFTLADSKYLDKLLYSVGVPQHKVPAFNRHKAVNAVEQMGWAKHALNRKFKVSIDTRGIQVDAVDIAGKHITALVQSNPLAIRNYLQDNPGMKMENVDPMLRPSLLFLSPDMSNAASFISMGFTAANVC
jgi:hypothetical protein